MAVTISLEVPPGMEGVARQEAREQGVLLLQGDRPGTLRCAPGCPPWRLLPALAPFTRTYLYAHETGLVEESDMGAPATGKRAAVGLRVKTRRS